MDDDTSSLETWIESCDSNPCVGYDNDSCKECYERATGSE